MPQHIQRSHHRRGRDYINHENRYWNYWRLVGRRLSAAARFLAGTLQLGQANVLPVAGNVTVNGTFDLNGFNQQIGNLTGSGSIDNKSGTGTYSLTTNGERFPASSTIALVR